jgi:hypothetical protein
VLFIVGHSDLVAAVAVVVFCDDAEVESDHCHQAFDNYDLPLHNDYHMHQLLQ